MWPTTLQVCTCACGWSFPLARPAPLLLARHAAHAHLFPTHPPSEYSFFQRGSVKEFLNFAVKTLMKRLTPGVQCVDYEGAASAVRLLAQGRWMYAGQGEQSSAWHRS